MNDFSAAATLSDAPHSTDVILAHLDRLPTLAPVAVRLLELVNSRDASVAEVVRLVGTDQALTAKLLSVASSAAAGARGPVTTLERAVVLLGFGAVRNVVLALCVFQCFQPEQEDPRRGAGFNRTEFWKHAIGVACAARQLARLRTGEVDPEEAFIAGLLHDMGKLALDAVFPKTYRRVAARADQLHCDVADCERALLGLDHTIAGRKIAERWGLPRSLQEVVWLHHLAHDGLPSSVVSRRMIALVQLADTLVRERHIGYSGNHVLHESSRELARQLGVNEAQLETVTRNLVQEVSAQAEVLGLHEAAPEALYVLSIERANGELGRLNGELEAANRRLAAAARYFSALTSLDHSVTASSDLAAVVAATADAARAALQRSAAVAFAVRDNAAMVDLACASDAPSAAQPQAQVASPSLREWLSTTGDLVGRGRLRAAAALRPLVEPYADALGPGELWLIPILHLGRLQGGILYRSTRDEAAENVGENAELLGFAGSLGLALGRVNAQAAARRLSDELAETNRRLQQMRGELLRSRTLSMIAEMAAGAGHELNGPLSVISGRAQLLAAQLADGPPRKALEQISAKAHECSRIVTELMDFARPRPLTLNRVNLPELLRRCHQDWLTSGQLPPGRLHLVEPGPHERHVAAGEAALVRGDADQLRLALDELLRNAAEAIHGRHGEVTISWRRTRGALAAPRAEPASSDAADEAAEIQIRDTGTGMSHAVLQRAFDPFFSHHTAGRRRGLGLPRAHRVIEAHGGRVWLESRPDEGTTAHVLLPLTH